jgi:hypothetical protein
LQLSTVSPWLYLLYSKILPGEEVVFPWLGLPENEWFCYGSDYQREAGFTMLDCKRVDYFHHG